MNVERSTWEGCKFLVLGSQFSAIGYRLSAIGYRFLYTMRLSRFGCILIAASSVTCALAAALLFALRPRPITSHADAIATILDRRGIVYERVTTDQVWPAAVNYYAYGPSVYPYSATVSVRLPDDTIVPGSLECADDRRRCRVTIARFGIDREPIPDISSVRPLPWTEWLRQVIQIVRSFGYVTFVSNVLEKHPQVASFQVDRFSLTVFQNNDTILLNTVYRIWKGGIMA